MITQLHYLESVSAVTRPGSLYAVFVIQSKDRIEHLINRISFRCAFVLVVIGKQDTYLARRHLLHSSSHATDAVQHFKNYRICREVYKSRVGERKKMKKLSHICPVRIPLRRYFAGSSYSPEITNEGYQATHKFPSIYKWQQCLPPGVSAINSSRTLPVP